MRGQIVTALVSSATTLSILVVMYFYSRDGTLERLFAPASLESTTSAVALRPKITSLESEIGELRNSVDSFRRSYALGNTSKDREGLDKLHQRISKLESHLEHMSNVQYSKKQIGSGKPTATRDRIEQATEVTTEQRREAAEAQFYRDDGLPLGEFSQSIEYVIHELSEIQAQGIDCRNTICKVTYATVDERSSDSEDWEWELMENLLEHSAGKLVDIRYVKNSFGADTMYIQLN